ncbi:hypothetical protein CYLTODRAFT_375813 [Cylindrobasidium torrendii FP15055 ss-10]|uniref:WW domain-containing protein n=1 Tax=Cylindrobasidium torrendii FP15055 ss-10 TaxID=1314674 RepID=A0A0D7BBQ4_9AGAR|nr:hypothetical protein CYLTODRAFT_375813 [Cylindrobasidium torrendii FP15055 ss-10]
MSAPSSPKDTGRASEDPEESKNVVEESTEKEENKEDTPKNQPDDSSEAPSDAASPPPSGPAVATNGDWQAIFAPQYNAYYFFNTKTQETTWTNPVEPTASSSSSATPAAAPASEPVPTTAGPSTSRYAAAAAAGIDPALAYLDPTLGSGPAGSSGQYAAAARFNARTGRFTAEDGRHPEHMSEYERSKRMSQFYFDVDAWQKQNDARAEEEDPDSKKRKRPSKKDLDRFKEQKKQKKIAKTAWLRT